MESLNLEISRTSLEWIWYQANSISRSFVAGASLTFSTVILFLYWSVFSKNCLFGIESRLCPHPPTLHSSSTFAPGRVCIVPVVVPIIDRKCWGSVMRRRQAIGRDEVWVTWAVQELENRSKPCNFARLFWRWDCEVTWWANGLMSTWCHLVQVSLWVHLSSLVQVVRSIVTASFHFAFFHLGRLLRQMETSGSGWGVVFRWLAWWCCV